VRVTWRHLVGAVARQDAARTGGPSASRGAGTTKGRRRVLRGVFGRGGRSLSEMAPGRGVPEMRRDGGAEVVPGPVIRQGGGVEVVAGPVIPQGGGGEVNLPELPWGGGAEAVPTTEMAQSGSASETPLLFSLRFSIA
jgi:hypothetical protein